MSKAPTPESLVTSPLTRGDGTWTPPREIDAAAETLADAPHRGAYDWSTGWLTRLARRPWNDTRHIPLAAWICALVATLNGIAWSVVLPPFQAPDEPSHFAYVQHLAETGKLPSSGSELFPQAEEVVLTALLQQQVRFSQENHTISSLAEQQNLERELALPLSRSDPGDAGVAASQPPLYYALATVPYDLASSGTLLDRLALTRVLSALMGGLTALFVFLFLRVTLAAAPWSWTVGGLGVALMPAFGMMSGAVNPDALLFVVSTALFYCLAQGFRRGLTWRLALAIGSLIAIGCLTKLTFLGLLPGAICGLLALAVRTARETGRTSYARPALALGIAALPACLYAIVDARSGGITRSAFSRVVALFGHVASLPHVLSFFWQYYLPRLPGMSAEFHGTSGSWLWFEQLTGKYGWDDTTFPAWVVHVALLPVAAIALLFVRALLINRRSLSRRRVEAAVYAAMCLGILAVIAGAEYIDKVPGAFQQLRYVLPAIALIGALLALAARGAGRRWGPVVGVFIVLLTLAHDLFSQLLVVSRYYG
jgi:hypothetical protein